MVELPNSQNSLSPKDSAPTAPPKSAEHDGAPLENPFGPKNPCFGCASEHPFGMHLKPFIEGEWVCARFVPPLAYQGPRSIMHGGLVTTLADEIAAWAVIAKLGKFGFTVEMSTKFKGPVRVSEPTFARARLTQESSRVVLVYAEIWQADALRYEGSFKFALMNEQGAERMLGGPVPPEWKQFLR
jgi:acyl-coenzyme A thioesterase PaaI-like protein